MSDEYDALADLHPIERELVARERAASAAGSPMTMDQLRDEYEKILAERHHRLERDAHASWRAMASWAEVATEEDWVRVVAQADDDFDSGQFLLSRLGAARYLDPPLMAVLLRLRRRLVEEHGARTAADLMTVDLAVLAYYHALRVTGWIGDLSQALEAEFFRKGGLGVRLHPQDKARRDVKVRGLTVEEIVERLADRLMPLLDRSNKMLLRNLQALEARRRPPAPSVTIAQAGQVNVAAVQANHTDHRPAAHKEGGRRGRKTSRPVPGD